MPSGAYRLDAKQQKILALCFAVAVFGFFDFTIFWYSSDAIAALFFAKNASDAERNSFALLAFLAAYLLRPLGGVFFGNLADRWGRKKSLIANFLWFSACALLLACMPTYEQWGIAASAAFLGGRLLQGFAFGSQSCLLWVYLCETMPLRSIGFACAAISAGGLLGGFLAFVAIYHIEWLFTQAELLRYGFRALFVIGALLGLAQIRWLWDLDESPVFLRLTKPPANALAPQKTRRFWNMRAHVGVWFSVLLVVFLSWLASSVVAVAIYLFRNIADIGFVADDRLLSVAVAVCLAFLTIGCVFFGLLIDFVNAGKALCVGCILFGLSTAFWAYDLETGGRFVLLSFALMGFFGGVVGALPAVMTRLCPAAYRGRIMCVCYSVAMTIVGLTLPFLLRLVMHRSPFVLSVYFGFLCIMAMFFAFYLYYLPRDKEQILR